MLKIHVLLRSRLKVLMAEVGCRSIKELSEETGIHYNSLQRLATGTNMNLTLANIFRLLNFFDCKFEDLFQADISSNEPNHIDDIRPEILEGLDDA